jgi:asparagine synthase (glutamine-hydrolysing)
LFERLYPQIFRTAREKKSFRQFMLYDQPGSRDPFFSHLVRWRNTARIRQFFSKAMRAELGDTSPVEEFASMLPPGFEKRDTLSRAQYLEDKVFLSGYLLTSQGDRMAMANSVEIRPPFLDFRIVDFMSRVPPRWKILGLDEKHILKKAFQGLLPESITKRTKHPYRAPVQKAFMGRLASDVYCDALSERAIRKAGIFDPHAVLRLFAKLDSGESRSETEGMAVAGIISAQLLFEQYVQKPYEARDAPMNWDVRVDRRSGARG